MSPSFLAIHTSVYLFGRYSLDWAVICQVLLHDFLFV